MHVFSLFSLIPLVIVLAVFVVSVRAVWLTIVPPRRGVREPSCEKCRYPVTGLTTLTCPECGCSLLQSGIITRPMEMRRRGGLLGAICGTLFLSLMGNLILMALIGSVFEPYTIDASPGSSQNEDSLFVFYSLMYGVPAIGALLTVLMVLLIIRRRRKLLRDADLVAQPVSAPPTVPV